MFSDVKRSATSDQGEGAPSASSRSGDGDYGKVPSTTTK